MFLISKCRGELNLGVCMTSVLANRIRLRIVNLRFENVFGLKFRGKSALRSSILFARPKLMHRPRTDFPLHFDIRNIYQICMGK